MTISARLSRFAFFDATARDPRLPGTSVDLVLTPDQVTRATLAVGVNNLAPGGR